MGAPSAPAPDAAAPGAGVSSTSGRSDDASKGGRSLSPLTKLGVDFFAGVCGGVALTLVGHPLDTVKVRLQTQGPKPIYSGMIDCFRKTVQWEGLAGLYKGVASPLAGQMFLRANLFAAFGASKRWLSTNPDGTTRQLAPVDFYKAGAITGICTSLTETPIDFFKSQVQVQMVRMKQNPSYVPPYTTVWQVVKASIRENGVRGPWQGLSATMMRNSLAMSVNLGSFETIKQQYCRAYDCAPSEIPGWVVLAAGTTGGFLLPMVNFPCDQIKTAMMTDSIKRSERAYPSFGRTAVLLWKEGGVRRYYRGFLPCILRLGPAYGLMQLTVDKVSGLMNARLAAMGD